ncbi:hypothetical protein VTN31DRAFT_1380 [Thermomyces dupontii]|uniref:uncharacterized protein n=1 Tax=Talaromyces thermophilus TaxID=28565 RepID=UPI0037433B44
MPPSLIAKLSELLRNPGFPDRLAEELTSWDDSDHVYLRIEATVCHDPGQDTSDKPLLLGVADLHRGDARVITSDVVSSSNRSENGDESGSTSGTDRAPLTPQSIDTSDDGHHPSKRRKTVGGLRPSKPASWGKTRRESQAGAVEADSVAEDEEQVGLSVRQFQSEPRFPQRSRPESKEPVVPPMQPTSAEKFISGIWRQLHSPIQLSLSFPYQEPEIDIRTGVSGQVFAVINKLCSKYYNQNQSSRALEMIVQAYWVESYEARVASICLENPEFSKTEARMAALKEACKVLGWREKDLRNRMAIWRGYKEIKDAGGWASLIFASTGVYRFCKYRVGFDEGLTTRLRSMADAIEVAADTLHPNWRDLLQVIGQGGSPRYHGHPHEWVIMPSGPAVPLASTYEHLDLPGGFQFQFIDECVIDRNVFGDADPRVVPLDDPDICQVCKERQSDDPKLNRCSCFPTWFGSPRYPVPVQLFHTTNGKNNGVIARSNFDRGTIIGEFVGLVTRGIQGMDVMVAGSEDNPYQIFQGQMGNFTRFINHSCRANSQFQKFVWRGRERVVVVSRGITAGSEITVDYSDRYWVRLGKKCLCGEACCRFR